MATASKGRGRGRGLLRTVANKPGPDGDKENKTVVENGQFDGVEVQDIEAKIKQLSLDINEEDLISIQELTEKLSKDEQKLKDVAEIIYKKSLQDREFAKLGACICDRLTNIPECGNNFRTALLKLVQGDFKDKDEIRKKSTSRFLGLFTFVCQMFGNMKDSKGDPFKVLIFPIFQCIDAVIDSERPNDDEYECLSLQIQSIGKDLETLDQSKMNLFMEKVRQQIIREGSTARGRCTLLELLECHARSWKTMPNDVTRFYCDTMADILAGMVV